MVANGFTSYKSYYQKYCICMMIIYLLHLLTLNYLFLCNLLYSFFIIYWQEPKQYRSHFLINEKFFSSISDENGKLLDYYAYLLNLITQ
jgi:hypothetical protein